MRSFQAVLEAELAELVAIGRHRACPELAGLSRTSVAVSGEPRLSFCSKITSDWPRTPNLATAAAAAAARDGFGASASRLVSGDLPAHRQLETALARFFGLPAALVFPTGYQTNIGVLTALAGPDDVIVSDALNHASIIDGCRLSRARIAVYPHGDPERAAHLLDQARTARRRLLVTESLFSMNGDAAPLARLAEAAQRHDAIFIVDEAHAIGVFGPRGRGLCAAADVTPDVLIGTLGRLSRQLGASRPAASCSAIPSSTEPEVSSSPQLCHLRSPQRPSRRWRLSTAPKVTGGGRSSAPTRTISPPAGRTPPGWSRRHPARHRRRQPHSALRGGK